MSVLTYVDDCILFSHKQKHIDPLIDQLKKGQTRKGIDGIEHLLGVEGNYAGFLGIDIGNSIDVDEALELLQTGLIDRIIAAPSLEYETTKPASTKALGKDKSGPGRKEHWWSYPPVIGMMVYLDT